LYEVDKFFFVWLAIIFLSCNNANDGDTYRGGEKDPSVMQPPSDQLRTQPGL
jgi:hypothetical protein